MKNVEFLLRHHVVLPPLSERHAAIHFQKFYRRRGKFVDRFSIGCRRLAARGGVIHAIRRMVPELSSRSVHTSNIYW